MSRGTRAFAWMLLIASLSALNAEDARQLVNEAVHAELAADASDHSKWLYYEIDIKPGHTVKQWVAETPQGDLDRIMEDNGRPLTEQEQRSRMNSFIRNRASQEQRRKANQHDDQEATEMLNLLPNAFIWNETGTQGDLIILHFKPNPQFRPPTYEARVFAAMEGDMAVDKEQRRIASLKGRMIRAVKFGYGLFGELDPGGTFNVERRQTGKSVWQITETHVHIHGHALLFKTISEQEDDVKSKLKQLPGNLSFQAAEKQLLAQSQ
jgi:hypothetical protein